MALDKSLIVLQDNPLSSLVQVQNTNGDEYWVKRSSLHKIGDKAYQLTERQAAISQRAHLRRQKAADDNDAKFAALRRKQQAKRDSVEQQDIMVKSRFDADDLQPEIEA